ncbi:MAG: Slp family lipoprotein [Deltaproteobacteria bacterium]|nr:Slp family lipoprotein [Deltaproteobacteria bacterium]
MGRTARQRTRSRSRVLLATGMNSLLFFFFLLFSSCTTVEKRPDAKAAYEKIPFSEIFASPQRYRGRTVRLGGVIIETTNTEEETTIEILQKPLNRRGRPKAVDETGGRFIVVFRRFLDKAVYRPDRPVTVVGEIIGSRTGLIGETTYHYPLLLGKEIHPWKGTGYSAWPFMHIGIGIGTGGGGTSGAIGIGTSF